MGYHLNVVRVLLKGFATHPKGMMEKREQTRFRPCLVALASTLERVQNSLFCSVVFLMIFPYPRFQGSGSVIAMTSSYVILDFCR